MWRHFTLCIRIQYLSASSEHMQQQDSRRFLGEAKVHGTTAEARSNSGRGPGSGRVWLRVAVTLWHGDHRSYFLSSVTCLAELRRSCRAGVYSSRLPRRCVVVFHYAERHIYCQLVGWYASTDTWCSASSMLQSVAPDCFQSVIGRVITACHTICLVLTMRATLWRREAVRSLNHLAHSLQETKFSLYVEVVRHVFLKFIRKN